MRTIAMCLGLVIALGACVHAAERFANARVTTIAGDGYAGIRDGAGASARFMQPSGIAYDAATNAIYVTDSAAQRIRKIDAAGNVTTVAGSGPVARSGLDVVGGYRDGPAQSASFNHPTGIAIGDDGAIYVADSFNRCIRRIEHGVVSTFAGVAGIGNGTAVDGALRTATFNEPRGLAFDANGALYVADFGRGIRTIANGAVSTLTEVSQPYVTSVSVYRGNPSVLVYASPSAIGKYVLAARVPSAIVTDPAPLEPVLGYADVLAIDASTALVTNARYQTIGAIDFSQAEPHVRLLSHADEDDAQVGGFADGLLRESDFYDPLGMALIAPDVVVVADSSNRRIRKIVL